jgi:hypothetical protein
MEGWGVQDDHEDWQITTRAGRRRGTSVWRVSLGTARGLFKPEWPKLVPIFYGHHDLSTLLLGTVPTKRSELVDMVEPTSS